jgi:crotonobetainyl-CoA:carnitine CoA-transferase CaiB-like acyl-CoA transferase
MSTPASAGPASRPLSGVRVLDLSRLLPGPFCTLILSDLGAQVDKVEDPHVGDYLRLFPPTVSLGGDDAAWQVSARFAAINRDKRSLSLDLKHPAGRAAFLRLLPKYDVLVESFRPGVLARLGLGIDVLQQHNPRLVICSITGYGQAGPYRDRAGHDLNYLAVAGVLGLVGENSERPPHPMPIQLADLGAGALWPAVQILAALRVAERDGRGSHLDVAMCEGSLSFLIPELGNRAGGGAAPRRGQELLTGGQACYGVYKTADGRYLSVGALEPKFWLAFNAAIGRAGDPSELLFDDAGQAAVRADIQARLLQKTRDEWTAHFGALGTDVCVEPVLELDELTSHPQHAARELFFTIPGEGSQPPLAQVRTPALPPSATGTVQRPPQLGEHSAQILGEAGLSAAEIAALVAAGAARQARGQAG